MNDLLENVGEEVSSKAIEKAKGSMSPHVTSQVTPPVTSDVALYAMIERLAVNPDVDVEKLNGILDLKERMMNKDAEMQFNAALSDMQSEMPIIKKDGSVEYPKDKNNPDGPKVKAFDFASFENIMRAIKPVMSKYGFAIRFDTSEREGNGGGAIIKATLSHRAGHKESVQFAAALDTSGGKNNIQAMGSTFSYGKRYCVTALLNIVTEGEDDDANKAFLEHPIDDVQFAEIQRLIDDTDTDMARFVGHLKIESLRAMPQKMYAKATHDLEAKRLKLISLKTMEGKNDEKSS